MRNVIPRIALFAGAAIIASGAAHAVPVVDGMLDVADYGSAIAVQTVETNFGDNQSELNAAYAFADATDLYLLFTGNLENNFNKLVVFFDSVPGSGQNSISGTNNPQNFDSLIGAGFANGWDPYVNRGLADSPLQAQAGQFTFDAGFAADRALMVRHGAGKTDFDFAIMDQTATEADEIMDVFSGFEEGASGPVVDNFSTSGGSGATFEIGFDNSNILGIGGGTSAADQASALAVTTGMEFKISLASLGIPTVPSGPAGGGAGIGGTDVKITAFINGSNHDFLSNQSLAGFDVPPLVLGDANNDGAVTADDLIAVQQNFGGTGFADGLLLGDANDDGTVTADDLISVQQNFGDLGLPPFQDNLGSDGNGNFLSADQNLDGVLDDLDDYDGSGLGADPLGVGLIDLSTFAGDQFFTVAGLGAEAPAGGGVPEPATAALLAMGTIAVLGRRRG